MDAVFFANSGSEANEVAFKLARFHHFLQGNGDKVKIITRRDAYHGGTLATTAATGMPPFWRGFGPLDPTFIRAGTNYCYHCEWNKTYPGCGLDCAVAIEDTIIREGPDTVAAVIAEPVHGAGGVIPPVPEYFPKLRQICDRHNVLLIADEVITGFGRTGKWFALQHWDVEPDIVTFAKAVTSAYIPLSGRHRLQGHAPGAARTRSRTSASCTATRTRPTPRPARSACATSRSWRTRAWSRTPPSWASACCAACAPCSKKTASARSAASA